MYIHIYIRYYYSQNRLALWRIARAGQPHRVATPAAAQTRINTT